MRRSALPLLATALVGAASWVHFAHVPATTAVCSVPEPDRVEVAPVPVVPSVEAATASEATPAPGDAAPLEYGEAFAFVIELDGPHLVLSTTVSGDWARGDLDLEAPDTASSDVDAHALPLPLREVSGGEVELFGLDGNLIVRGRVGTPRIISQLADPTTRTLDTYELFAMHERGERFPPDVAAEVADLVWDYGEPLLVAPIVMDDDADPGDVVFARAAGLPRPTVFAPDALRGGWQPDRPALFADFNADGRPDVLLAPGQEDGAHTLLAGTDNGPELVVELHEIPELRCHS